MKDKGIAILKEKKIEKLMAKNKPVYFLIRT